MWRFNRSVILLGQKLMKFAIYFQMLTSFDFIHNSILNHYVTLQKKSVLKVLGACLLISNYKIVIWV